MLGDNIFSSASMRDLLARSVARTGCATVFSYQFADPERYAWSSSVPKSG